MQTKSTKKQKIKAPNSGFPCRMTWPRRLSPLFPFWLSFDVRGSRRTYNASPTKARPQGKPSTNWWFLGLALTWGQISKQTNLNQVNFISFVFVYLVGWHESCRGELVAGIGSIFVKFNLVCFNFIYLLCSWHWGKVGDNGAEWSVLF